MHRVANDIKHNGDPYVRGEEIDGEKIFGKEKCAHMCQKGALVDMKEEKVKNLIKDLK